MIATAFVHAPLAQVQAAEDDDDDDDNAGDVDMDMDMGGYGEEEEEEEEENVTPAGADTSTAVSTGTVVAHPIPVPPREYPVPALGNPGGFAVPGGLPDANLTTCLRLNANETLHSFVCNLTPGSPEWGLWREASVPDALRFSWDWRVVRHSSTAERLPHQWVGKWWYTDDIAFAALNPARKGQMNHVFRIMETDLGEVVVGGEQCQHCINHGYECARYRQTSGLNSTVAYPGNVCARCRYANRTCVKQGGVHAKRASPKKKAPGGASGNTVTL